MDKGINVVLFAVVFFGGAAFFAYRRRLYPQALIAAVIAGALVEQNFPGAKLFGNGVLAMLGISSAELGPIFMSGAMLVLVLYGLHRMLTGARRK